MAGLRTEFEFTLPKGYVGPDGTLHRQGVMRLATARDEIEPLRDRSIDGPDDPYLTILVLARVITELGTLSGIGVGEVENLFAADLAFLQDLYGIINFGSPADVAALQAAATPPQAEPDAPTPDSVPEVVAAPAGGKAASSHSKAAASDDPDNIDRTAKAVSSRRRDRIEEVARPGGS